MVVEKESVRKLEIRRVGIDIKFPENQLKIIKTKFTKELTEYKYKYYKVYWPHVDSIKIYRDYKKSPSI